MIASWPRPSRVLALAFRDLRMVATGKRRLGLAGIALLLLLPIGAVPFRPAPRLPGVAGEIPVALAGELRPDADAAVRLVGSNPVVVEARGLPSSLRRVLDGLPGEPRVVVRRPPRELELPGRSLLVALLAVSLMTGPLSESLAGERSRGTLETLLSAGISRGELVLGKWLAWTAAASGICLITAASAVLSGAQAAGLWPLALPLVAGCAAALGLWLGRGAADVLSGAVRSMRVLPLAAVVAAGLSWLVSSYDPLLAAAVPLGGAVLVAAAVFQGPAPLAVAAVGAGLGAAVLLAWTARDLDRIGVAPQRSTGQAPVGTAWACWWLAVVGPGCWAVAGRPDLAEALAQEVSLLAAGSLLLLLCAVGAARAHWRLDVPRLAGLPRAVVVGLAVALGASVLGWSPWPQSEWFAMASPRFATALAPGRALHGAGAVGALGGLAVVVGSELFFRGLLQRERGVLVALIWWVLIASPTAPLLGLVSGAALGLLAQRWGVLAAIVAHGVWALCPPSLAPDLSAPVALTLIAVALTLAAAPSQRAAAG